MLFKRKDYTGEEAAQRRAETTKLTTRIVETLQKISDAKYVPDLKLLPKPVVADIKRLEKLAIADIKRLEKLAGKDQAQRLINIASEIAAKERIAKLHPKSR